MPDESMTDLDYQREAVAAIASYRELRAAGVSAQDAAMRLYQQSPTAADAAERYEQQLRAGRNEQAAADAAVAGVLTQFDNGYLPGSATHGPARWEHPGRLDQLTPVRPNALNTEVLLAVDDFGWQRANGRPYAEALSSLDNDATTRRAVREFDRLTTAGWTPHDASKHVALQAVGESVLEHYVSLRQHGRDHEDALREAADGTHFGAGVVNRFARRIERNVPTLNAYSDAIAETIQLTETGADGPVIAAREGTPAERAEPASTGHQRPGLAPGQTRAGRMFHDVRTAIGRYEHTIRSGGTHRQAMDELARDCEPRVYYAVSQFERIVGAGVPSAQACTGTAMAVAGRTAVEHYQQLRDAGRDHGEAMAEAADGSATGKASIALYARLREEGQSPSDASTQAVYTADRYSRALAHSAERAARDDGSDDDVDGDLDEELPDSYWDETPRRPDVPERAPDSGSWIARNLPPTMSEAVEMPVEGAATWWRENAEQPALFPAPERVTNTERARNEVRGLAEHIANEPTSRYEQLRAAGMSSNGAVDTVVAEAHPSAASQVWDDVDDYIRRSEAQQAAASSARHRPEQATDVVAAQGSTAEDRHVLVAESAGQNWLHLTASRGGRGDRPDLVERIDAVLADEPASALGEQVTACGQAVDAADGAVRHADASHDDHERAEQIARWQAEDRAIERADATAETWEQP